MTLFHKRILSRMRKLELYLVICPANKDLIYFYLPMASWIDQDYYNLESTLLFL